MLIPITNYPDYLISSWGRVFSLKYGQLKELKFRVHHGYRYINLCNNGKVQTVYIHKIVAREFLPNPNNYTVVNHKDGNKQNNHFTNLEWCTVKQNVIHAVKLGLLKPRKGEDSNLSKLTWKQIEEIRTKYIPYEYSMNKLSKDYNVSLGTIKNIIYHKSWK